LNHPTKGENRVEKPRKAHFNQRRQTSTLYFEKFDDFGEFHMRGAVYWPATESGFALLAGQKIETKRVHVFEQMEFDIIDNIIGKDRTIEYYGLAPWLNRCWSKYYAKKFFWSQHEELHRRFRLQVSRSQAVLPKPAFIEAPLSDEDEARYLVFDYAKTGRIVLEKGSELAKQLELAKHDEKAELSAVRALGRLLAGLERYPFSRHNVEEEREFY
jgi:hypothetical protein